MLLILLTACALAEETEPTVYTAGDWDYILLADGTAEIVGYTGAATELTIPTEHDGHAVTSSVITRSAGVSPGQTTRWLTESSLSTNPRPEAIPASGRIA